MLYQEVEFNMFKKIIKTCGMTFAITFVVLVSMYHSSCHISGEGITLVSEKTEIPKIKDIQVDGEKISVEFTGQVIIENSFAVEKKSDESSINAFLNSQNKIPVSFQVEQNKALFSVLKKTDGTKLYNLYSLARDKKGNSLSFAVPFYGKSENETRLFLSEISESYLKKEEIPEYIELYVSESGNLFGFELISASDGRHFELPACDVKKGEYVLVHLRKPDENCIDETDNRLSLSKGKASVNGVRDIWINNQDSVLNSTCEIVILNNKAKNRYEDCVVYCKSDYADENLEYKNKNIKTACEKLVEQNLWKSSLPKDAVWSEKRKSISFISRKNVRSAKEGMKSREEWEGTAKSKMTPGKPNQF